MVNMENNYTKLSIDITKSLTKDQKKNDGIFFTPPQTVKSDIDYLLRQINNIDIKTILEPSCGSCEFINYLNTKVKDTTIHCIEFNKKIYENIKKLDYDKNEVEFFNEDFLDYTTNIKYDLIIGNPPFFNYPKKKIYKEYFEYLNGRTNIYILFLIKCLKLLSDNGILSFVLPVNFLNCSYYKKVRSYIETSYSILNISINDDKYLETQQKTCTIVIQNNTEKVDSANFIRKINNNVIFNTFDTIKIIDELLKNTQNLDELGFNVSVGNVVWNQEKDILTNDINDILLIYSSDISNNEYKFYNFSEKSEKNGKLHYIEKKNLKKNHLDTINDRPILVINRGYGKGDYIFNYALINENQNNRKQYLIENHLICIKPKLYISDKKLIIEYKKIIESFNNSKTTKFIKLFLTNDAINCNELQYTLPIFKD